MGAFLRQNWMMTLAGGRAFRVVRRGLMLRIVAEVVGWLVVKGAGVVRGFHLVALGCHRMETCPSRGHGAARVVGLSSTPHPWSPHYSYTETGNPRPHSKGNVFRALQGEEHFCDIANISEADALKVLRKYGLCPLYTKRHCYQCGKNMKLKEWKGRNPALRCRKPCNTMMRADTAYLPIHNSTTTFAEYLRVCYCFCTQLRQDQAVRFAKVNQTKVLELYSCLRDVAAWYTLHSTKDVVFNTGEVDMDAAKSIIDRSASQKCNVHRGRLFVMRERATGKRKVLALASAAVGKGVAGRPERNDEIGDTVR